MESILMRISQDETTWEDVSIPSSYSVSYEDLDDDSFRSVANGNLIRRRISRTWVKLSLSYNFLTSEQLNTLARQVNTNQMFYIRCKSPAFGNIAPNNTWVQFQAYCSNYQAEMLPLQSGWTVSLNIIQAKKSSFNG